MRVIWNTKDFFDKMGDVETKAGIGAKNAVQTVAEDVLTKSLREAPYLKGDLRRSGKVEHFDNYSFVSYGGRAASYAVYQHEGARADGTRKILRHTTHGTKTKYLIDPIMNNLPMYQEKFGAIFADFIT